MYKFLLFCVSCWFLRRWCINRVFVCLGRVLGETGSLRLVRARRGLNLAADLSCYFSPALHWGSNAAPRVGRLPPVQPTDCDWTTTTQESVWLMSTIEKRGFLRSNRTHNWRRAARKKRSSRKGKRRGNEKRVLYKITRNPDLWN